MRWTWPSQSAQAALPEQSIHTPENSVCCLVAICWQTVSGQHLTGWGMPSLRRAVAVQWDPKTLPTVGSNPWRLAITPINRWLITGNCSSPCCVDAAGEAGVSSPCYGCWCVGKWWCGRMQACALLYGGQVVARLVDDRAKGKAGRLQFGTRPRL